MRLGLADSLGPPGVFGSLSCSSFKNPFAIVLARRIIIRVRVCRLGPRKASGYWGAQTSVGAVAADAQNTVAKALIIAPREFLGQLRKT